MHGISVFVPLWINLNCLGGVVHIPESSEVGDGQWNRNGHIVFVASPVAALTPLHSLLLANMHRFYCYLVEGELPLDVYWLYCQVVSLQSPEK